MLHLHLYEEDYLTIGEDIVIKVREVGGKSVCLSIDAPRDLSILRGAVREREGGARPDCVDQVSPRKWLRP